MGVSGLWSLISPVGKEVNLECCRGKKLAVDLSAWIIQCSSVGTSNNKSEAFTQYQCCRGIFLRTVNLLSLGISLVFVIDGPRAPDLKKRKGRKEFYQKVIEYKLLLTSLGLPVLECDGEAEKMCAELNQLNLVDGVLTNDGDALIYGARTVYKGLVQEKTNHFATLYSMEDVTVDQNLSRRDLVAFALLSAGDFSDGVPSVREVKFIKLMEEFKSNNIEDALDRLVSWSSNTTLDSLNSQLKSLTGNKIRHCTKCAHEGSMKEHKSSGCLLCQADLNCTEKTTPNHPPCSCKYHVAEAFKTELKIRDLALQTNESFPDQSVIQEYLDPLPQSLSNMNLSLQKPDFGAVCAVLKQRLKFSFEKSMSFLVPATIKMAFHKLLPEMTIRPLQILSSCRVNFEKCYKIQWDKFEEDEFSAENANESSYIFPLSQTLFAASYPEMVEQFDSTSTSAVKRKSDNPTQTTMTSFFKAVKHSQPQK